MDSIKFDKAATLDPLPQMTGLNDVQLYVTFGQTQGTIIANGPAGLVRVPVDLSALGLDAIILAALGLKFQVTATKEAK